MRTSFCNPRPHLTYEVTEHTFQFLYSVLLSAFRWVVEYFQSWRAHEVQPLFTRKSTFLLGTLLLQRTSHSKVSLFSHNYHTECFPVYESPAAIESTTNQNTQTGEGTQMGSLRANVLTKKFSEKCRENQCFKAETRNPTSGESGKPTD